MVNKNINKNIKIILAEDDELVREMYMTGFKMAGYEIVGAKSGEEALQLVENNIPDVIISDIVMPDGDGFYFLEKIKKNEKAKKIPFIVLTNLFSDEDRKEALSLGADEYIIKADSTPKSLVERVEKIIKNL